MDGSGDVSNPDRARGAPGEARPSPEPGPAPSAAPDAVPDADAQEADLDRPDPRATARVIRVVDALVKGIRAHQLYDANNQAYRQFISGVRDAFSNLWEWVPELELTVEDRGFRWRNERVPAGEGRENLGFVFYKDGIRRVSFLPGFEEELTRFLDVVARAKELDRQGDDLVTLLWEQDFAFFQYVYVDILAEGLEIPAGEPSVAAEPYDTQEIAADAAERAMGESADAREATADADPAVVSSIRREDFEETLYFLDSTEMEQLQQEVEREFARDIRAASLNALFDRLADAGPKRQSEIIGILQQLLPGHLVSGHFPYVIMILRELDGVMDRVDALGEPQRGAVSELFDQLSAPDLLGPLVQSLEDGSVDPEPEELSEFFGFLRPGALPVLIRAAAAVQRAELTERLGSVISKLAGKDTEYTLSLLDSEEAVIAAGAARLVGRLELEAGVARVRGLLEREEADVRVAAVNALVRVGTPAAVKALESALEDPAREVRIAAARGIGALGHRPARDRLEEALRSRALRKADLTEKIAFFEAYGTLGGGESVELLDGFLNGRTLIGRRHPPELRACAALALGKVKSSRARAALEQAAETSNPTVRTAVTRALSGGEDS